MDWVLVATRVLFCAFPTGCVLDGRVYARLDVLDVRQRSLRPTTPRTLRDGEKNAYKQESLGERVSEKKEEEKRLVWRSLHRMLSCF